MWAVISSQSESEKRDGKFEENSYLRLTFSLIFRPSANFCSLDFWEDVDSNKNVISRSCSLCILMHTKCQREAFGISLPHPAIFELPLSLFFFRASRTSPAPYSPRLPPPCPPNCTRNHEIAWGMRMTSIHSQICVT